MNVESQRVSSRSEAKVADELRWLLSGQVQVEAALAALIAQSDDVRFDERWSAAVEPVLGLALRPAKRVRPLLFILGHALARGRLEASPELMRLGAALELLHTFMLIHDDVADGASLRRGAPALHRVLGEGKRGEDLAVVVGDHLFARALEAILEAPFPRAPAMARYMLQICRHTAVGQFLDLELADAPLAQVSVFQALKVARLKTARYGFVGPLVAGALLGDGSPALVSSLERIGTNAGLAYQLKDDLLGLFGDERVTGKDGGTDFEQRKRTFPVLAAWARAEEPMRARLEALWGPEGGRPEQLAEARALVRQAGGERATSRVIERTTRAARKALAGIDDRSTALVTLDQVLTGLAGRTA
jgi:geranylgeranyl diphosphate synthase type I